MYLLILFLSFFSPEHKPKTPPGTIKIAENFYVDYTEVTNADWKEYIYYKSTELEGFEDFQNGGDSPQIDSLLNSLKSVNMSYYSNPDYNYYPMTNISYQMVLDYCHWRTEVVNKRIQGDKNYKVVFRLPTKEEFEMIIEFEKERFLKQSSKIIKNSRAILERDTMQVMPVGKIRKNLTYNHSSRSGKKVYNLFNNAAEMSATKGIAYGMTNETINIDGDFMQETLYDGPSDIVGFRCVAEFIYED